MPQKVEVQWCLASGTLETRFLMSGSLPETFPINCIRNTWFTEDEKETIWHEMLLNCVMNKFFAINMINRYLSTKLILLFSLIQWKVAQLVPWLLLNKLQYLWIAIFELTEINSIQKPRLNLWHRCIIMSQLACIYIKREHFLLAHFFLGHPVWL